MTEERRRVEQLEDKVEKLSDAVGELKTLVAVVETKLDLLTDISTAARNEQQTTAKEVGVYGRQLSSFVTRIDDFGRFLDEIKLPLGQIPLIARRIDELQPAVTVLEADVGSLKSHRDQIIGGGKTFSLMVRSMWALVVTLGTGIVGLLGWLAGKLLSSPTPPAPPHP